VLFVEFLSHAHAWSEVGLEKHWLAKNYGRWIAIAWIHG
jgi:hypothetical protein